MTTSEMERTVPGIDGDPTLPGAAELLGEAGSAAVVEHLGTVGLRVLADEPVQALYYPGKSMLVRRVAWASRDDGEPARYSVCSMVERGEDGSANARPTTWAYPNDPGLPGLPQAIDGEAAREWAASLVPGLRTVSINPIAYRPRRRAVLRYDLRSGRAQERDERTLYVKVMTPQDADRLWALGASLEAASAPLALPMLRPGEGLLAFDGLPGTPMRQALIAGASLPSPARIAGLFDDFAAPRDLHDFRQAKRTARSGMRHARRVLRALLPDSSARVVELNGELKAILHAYPVEPQVIHGDMYEGQLMVNEDFSLSVLDLDDMGIGDPAQDAASFCGHLVALADSYPAAAKRVMAYRGLLRATFMERFDLPPIAFAAREAAIMLQLAPGPFRVLEKRWPERVERRVRLAEAILDEARPTRHKRATTGPAEALGAPV